MDHMKVLGGSLEAIAGEKAGIIKRGSGGMPPAVKTVEAVFAHRAAELNAPLTQLAGRTAAPSRL